MALCRRALRGVLLLCVASTTLIATPIVSASQPCNSHSGDVLLSRVDSHLAQCLPASASLAAFSDALIANELDATQRRPLAVVAFSPSAASLDRFAAAVATAVAGVAPTSHAARVIDLAAAAASPVPTHTLLHSLRSDMASALRVCPRQRTLFLMRQMERVRGDRLPLLDLFLDPMNGERATLHDAVRGREVDCSRAVFVFLYQVADGPVPGAAWRDFLVDKWRASAKEAAAADEQDGGQRLATEAFTPQALAGRLTTAVVLEGDEGDATGGDECSLEGFLTRLRIAQSQALPTATAAAHGPSTKQTVAAFGAVLLFMALLTQAKWFAAESETKKQDVEVVRLQQRRKGNSKKALAEKPGDAARLASLRSHSSVATTENSSSSKGNVTTKATKVPRSASTRTAREAEAKPTATTSSTANGNDAQPATTRKSPKKRGRRASRS